MYRYFGKRLMDIIFSTLAILLLLPSFFIIALLIKLDTNGPIFYRQIRMGKDFKPFGLYKFRTMVVDADKMGPLVTKDRDPRITKVGYYLRKWKLDELPQFFNVLKGDMSLVGPRPEVEKYVKLYKDDYTIVLTVKPGITDYATILFRDEEDLIARFDDVEKGYTQVILPKKIELYKKYIDDISFFTDIKLLYLTFLKIFRI
ncbi:sugar transferase [Calditerrivibrio nitroreducens]|uniref:Sugar transferase n=1 Tax=Calditerrivibrio nitroreducens (strain DSM 19672 / NBRC 101217 / Yu37-1) TaxID=768670 RepID=E4TIT7_CALNY|nr:sugar transferase [Calditerrivibrio nitroreducens]ADR18042.1 sugar transferase [Calditerrivibrio nitroreducens DSM 19672]